MQKLARALNIEQGEGVLISLILLQSFFIGTFMSTFDVAANALFFTSFSGDDLGKAYALSAVVGMIFTYVYIKLQSWMSFSKLAILNLSFISALSILMRVGFEYSTSKELIYTVFLLQGPLNTLAIVGFWGLMGRIFNLRQGKRLFGLVDSGQILGMIIICFAGPLIQQFMPETKDLIIISSVGIVFSVVMQIILSSKYYNQIEGLDKDIIEEKDASNSSTLSIIQMIKNPYISMMVFFVMLSMLAQFFVHYSFLVSAKTKYPTDLEFASFFFLFTGTVMIFTFVFKTFVIGKLMQMYGLKVNLLILPFLLILFTVIACISGTFFGYQESSSGFLMFFLFIALSKLFAQSLRGAIEVPAFKLLYQPLDQSIKYDIQAKIDGTINEFSALIGGLVLMGLSLISFVTLISYSYVLVFVMLVYIFIAFKLYQRYRDTLHETLNSFKGNLSKGIKTNNISDLLDSVFKSRKDNQAMSILKICKNIEPVSFENKLGKIFEIENKELQHFAIQNVGDLGISQYQNQIKQIAENTDESLATKVHQIIAQKDIKNDIKTVSKYLRSKDPMDKIVLLNEVVKDKRPNISVVAELLKDPNIKVKKAAIKSVGKLKDITLLPTVIDFIDNIYLRTTVSEVLLTFGREMFEMLDIAFYKSNFESNTLVQIISVYEKSKDKAAIPYLLKKLSFPDQQVVNKSLTALKAYNFKTDSLETLKVQQSIEVEIGIALWNKVALEEAKEYNLPDYMIKSLNQETEESVDHIYTLLSLIYDQKSILNIRENLESGTAEGIGFAIELLDLFVAEELKPKLFPIFDDIDINEKIYRLELFYPIQRLEKKELLIQIINRDYNYINNWTKACALYTILEDKDSIEITDDYIAQLFNKDPLLYQTAAWLIFSNNKDLFEKVISRVDSNNRPLINDFLSLKLKNNDTLLVEKGLFLSSNNWLRNLDGRLIASVCGAIQTIFIKEGDNINDIIDNYPLGIIKEGVINFNGVKVESGDIISDLVVDNKKKVEVIENTILYVIENDKFYDLLYLHDNFLELILNLIEEYYSQNKIDNF